MGLWGSTTSKDNRPKFLPEDDNASGSTGADNTPSQLVVGGHFPPLQLLEMTIKTLRSSSMY